MPLLDLVGEAEHARLELFLETCQNKLSPLRCFDCRKLNKTGYMVSDSVWRSAWPWYGVIRRELTRRLRETDSTARGRGILCCDCLSKRLGRPLEISDFTPAPINDEIRQGYAIGLRDADRRRTITMHAFAVVALIQQDGNLLSVSRKDDVTDKGFPGGKIDPGETEFEALVREVREETDVRILEAEPLTTIEDDSGYLVSAFRVTSWAGEPRSVEAGVVEWLEPTDLVSEACTWKGFNATVIRLLEDSIV